MSARKQSVRLAAAAAAAGALLGATATTASAWPIPLTWEDDNYLGAVRGAWPADDDTLLMAGRGACHLLYTGSAWWFDMGMLALLSVGYLSFVRFKIRLKAG